MNAASDITSTWATACCAQEPADDSSICQQSMQSARAASGTIGLDWTDMCHSMGTTTNWSGSPSTRLAHSCICSSSDSSSAGTLTASTSAYSTNTLCWNRLRSDCRHTSCG